MKHIIRICLVLLILILPGCSKNSDELKIEINNLTIKHDILQTEVQGYSQKKLSLQSQIEAAKKELETLNQQTDEKTSNYILTLELEQANDAKNKIQFSIAVDKELYDQQEVDQELLQQFRGNSFWTPSNIGDWVITVIDKKIELEGD